MNDVSFFEIPYGLLEKRRRGVVSVFEKGREEAIKIAKETIEKSHPHKYEIEYDEIRELKVVDGVFHDWWWSGG